MFRSPGLPDAYRWRNRRRRGARAPRGFTLLELLVALMILAVLGGALVQSFSLGLRGARAVERHQIALALAQSYLDRLGRDLPLEEGELSGSLEGGFEWRASVLPYPVSAKAGPNRQQVDAYAVEVAVHWDESSAVALKTLRLAPARTGAREW